MVVLSRRPVLLGTCAALVLMAVESNLARSVLAAPTTTATETGRPLEAKLPFEPSTLANGMRVVLHEDHRTSQVAVNVWYRVGFSDDPPGKRGLAHLFEHLMLRGSKHVGRDRFFSILERAGASELNATTSLDRTNYFETLPSNQLALALWLESDRMGFFIDTLEQSVLDKEKEVVRNEYRLGMLDTPYSFVQRFARHAVYTAGHPYHWRIEGEIEDTDAITLEDLRAFFRTYYAPNNATLVVAGDIDPVATKALVTKYFGSLPPGAQVPGTPPASLTHVIDSEVRIEVEAGAEAPRLMIGWPGPAQFSDGDVRLGLVADVLARPKAGRLYDALVRGDAIADAVDVWSDIMGVRHGRILWLKVELKKGVEPARALEALDRVLDELRANGPTLDEVEQAKSRSFARLLWSLERTTRRADLLNQLDWIGGDPSALTKIQTWTAASTPTSLRDAVTRWLPKDRRAVVLVKHAPGAPVCGRLVKR